MKKVLILISMLAFSTIGYGSESTVAKGELDETQSVESNSDNSKQIINNLYAKYENEKLFDKAICDTGACNKSEKIKGLIEKISKVNSSSNEIKIAKVDILDDPMVNGGDSPRQVDILLESKYLTVAKIILANSIKQDRKSRGSK